MNIELLQPPLASAHKVAAQRCAGEADLRKEEVQRLRAALDALPDPVFFLDYSAMMFLDANRAASLALDYTRGELLAAGPRQIVAAEAWPETAASLALASKGRSPALTIRTRHRGKHGDLTAVQWTVSRIRCGRRPLLLLLARNVEQELPAACNAVWRSSGAGKQNACCVQLEAVLRSGAGRDPLTQLLDRRLFEQCLRCALQRTQRRTRGAVAVLFIDLDGFKAVNDSYGHLAGDRVLCQVAQRLSGSVRPGDMVARRGGDEFTVLLGRLRNRADAVGIAERICDCLRRPIDVAGSQLTVTGSIGIAVSGRARQNAAALLREADFAMYRAKALGGAGYVVSAAHGCPWNQ